MPESVQKSFDPFHLRKVFRSVNKLNSWKDGSHIQYCKALISLLMDPQADLEAGALNPYALTSDSDQYLEEFSTFPTPSDLEVKQDLCAWVGK